MSKLLLSVIIFIISNNLLAIVFGGSNLGMFGYSSHDCSKPYRPYQFNSQYEVDDYNNEVLTSEDYTVDTLDMIEFFNDNIEDFVKKCKQNEDLNGYIKQSFFNFEQKENCKFISGPFTNFVFDILKENKKSLDIISGDYKVSVSKEQNLFRPV